MDDLVQYGIISKKSDVGSNIFHNILYSMFCSELSYTILPCYICLYIMKTSIRWENGEKVASLIAFYYYVKL